MPDTATVSYRGATLGVDLEVPGTISLRINGLIRQTEPLDDAHRIARLGSTVQTDYEWHEHIECVAELDASGVTLKLSANNQLLLDARYLKETQS